MCRTGRNDRRYFRSMNAVISWWTAQSYPRKRALAGCIMNIRSRRREQVRGRTQESAVIPRTLIIAEYNVSHARETLLTHVMGESEVFSFYVGS